MRILVTGMSGGGKSTLFEEWACRGFLAVDTDCGDWKAEIGERREERMTALLSEQSDVILSGTVANQGQFYDRFDHVLLLSAPIDVLIACVITRTNSPHGKTPTQQEQIRRNFREVMEPLIRASASIELDARHSPKKFADEVQAPLMDQ